MRTTTLRNGYHKVAVNTKVYKNRIYFDTSSLSQIDTTVIYEETKTIYEGLNKTGHVLARYNYKDPNTIYFAYRFYSNGCFNIFILDRKKEQFTSETFDPLFEGYRGVLYIKMGKIKGDEVVPVSGTGVTGILTETFEFNGDSLLIIDHAKNLHIYVKRHIPHEFLNFNATW